MAKETFDQMIARVSAKKASTPALPSGGPPPPPKLGALPKITTPSPALKPKP